MLQLKLDLTDGTIKDVTAPADGSQILAGHRAAIQLDVFAASTARPLVTGEVITLQLAQADKYDSALASITITIANVDATITNRYLVYLDALNSDIETLLGIGGTTTDDQASARCRLDVALLALAQTVPDPIAELEITLLNSTFAAGASIPFATPAGIFQPFEITALSGNLATTLDGIATVSMSAGRVVWVWFSNALAAWRLTTGTDATATGIQRPADYNASTNAKVWKQAL